MLELLRILKGSSSMTDVDLNLTVYPLQKAPMNAWHIRNIMWYLLGQPHIEIVTDGKFEKRNRTQHITTSQPWNEIIHPILNCPSLVLSYIRFPSYPIVCLLSSVLYESYLLQSISVLSYHLLSSTL